MPGYLVGGLSSFSSQSHDILHLDMIPKQAIFFILENMDIVFLDHIKITAVTNFNLLFCHVAILRNQTALMSSILFNCKLFSDAQPSRAAVFD